MSEEEEKRSIVELSYARSDFLFAKHSCASDFNNTSLEEKKKQIVISDIVGKDVYIER
jgi:hypothetical protein